MRSDILAVPNDDSEFTDVPNDRGVIYFRDEAPLGQLFDSR